MAGPIALVGSGEYTDAMLDVDRQLLEGRAPRFIQLPTAAAPEGQATVDRWIRLGEQHAAKLGAEAVPLRVHTRDDAQDPSIVDRLGDPGLIYFSGGDPIYLAETMRDTVLWAAIVQLWQAGAALAGCSAGAMVFGGWVPSVRHPSRSGVPGLGLLPQVCVLPHFDRFLGGVPDLMSKLALPEDDLIAVGIDEDTALVGGPHEFTVHGRSVAWLLTEHPQKYPVGSTIRLTAPQ